MERAVICPWVTALCIRGSVLGKGISYFSLLGANDCAATESSVLSTPVQRLRVDATSRSPSSEASV